MINVRQHFEKVASPYIFKSSNDRFLVSNNDFRNIPSLLSLKKRLEMDWAEVLESTTEFS